MLQPCANRECSVHYPLGAARCPACGTPAPQTGANPEVTTVGPGYSIGGMTAEEIRGKSILVTYLSLIVLISLVICVLWIAGGREGILSRVMRLGLTILLCSALYSGSLAARRIAQVLLGLGGVLALVAVVMTPDLYLIVMVGPMAAVYISFILVLEYSSSVNAFMAGQRRRKRSGTAVLSASSELPRAEPQTCPMCGAEIGLHTTTCPACGEGLAVPQQNE